MTLEDAWPSWYRITVGIACGVGGMLQLLLGYRAYGTLTFMGAAVWIGGTYLQNKSRKSKTTEVTMQPASRSAMQARGVALILGSSIIAVGAALLIAKAGGNITVYVLGGVLLALMLYFIVSALVNWKKATTPKNR